MNILKNQILTRTHKKPILYDVFQPEEGTKHLVIFCHGYKGFKDWGAWHLVAKEFVKAGYAFLKFNFSHNGGTMEEPIDFPDLEAFGQNNFSKELDDLNDIIDLSVRSLNPDRIALIGHSRGGGVVTIKAEEDSRINTIISWAGLSDLRARFMEGTPAFDTWKKEGIAYVENSRTKQQMPHYFQYYEDFISNLERFTIKRAASNLSIPYLIVHGTEDPTVPVLEGKNLHSWNPDSKLHLIEGADHVFGVQHPWHDSTLPGDMYAVVEVTIDFLKSSATM